MSFSKYIVADSRALEVEFKRRKLKKVDLILTSPPYYNILNYGNAKNQIGQKQTYEEYLSDAASVLQQCYTLSTPQATLWLVVDTVKNAGRVMPLPFDINSKLTEKYGSKTWKLKDIITWDKGKNVPWYAKGRFKKQFEYIMFFAKNESYKFHVDMIREISFDKKWWMTYPERYNSGGSAPTNIWHYTIPIRGWGNGSQNHFCPFPFALVERILSLCTNKRDFVLDPFAGSGTVLALAKEMKRNSIGFDVNQGYKTRFEKEVLEGAKQYWSKRQVEIGKTLTQIAFFRKNNIRLRKIKASLSLATELRSKSGKKFIPIALSNSISPAGIKFLAVTDNYKQLRAKLRRMDKFVNEVERKFKVSFKISCISRRMISRNINGSTFLYRYSQNKIFSYDRKIAVKDLTSFQDIKSSLFIFSDLKQRLATNHLNGT